LKGIFTPSKCNPSSLCTSGKFRRSPICTTGHIYTSVILTGDHRWGAIWGGSRCGVPQSQPGQAAQGLTSAGNLNIISTCPINSSAIHDNRYIHARGPTSRLNSLLQPRPTTYKSYESHLAYRGPDTDPAAVARLLHACSRHELSPTGWPSTALVENHCEERSITIPKDARPCVLGHRHATRPSKRIVRERARQKDMSREPRPMSSVRV
jgi:hypothetical protein